MSTARAWREPRGAPEFFVQFLEVDRQKFIDEKRAQASASGEAFSETAQLCPKCHVKAVMLPDGCLTCLNCGDSKCG